MSQCQCQVEIHQKVQEYIASLKGADRARELRGTAIFLVADPAKGPLAVRKVKVQGLTYEETALRALRCLRSTWVPEAVMKPSAVGEGCAGGCVHSGDCTIGCFCDPFDGCG